MEKKKNEPHPVSDELFKLVNPEKEYVYRTKYDTIYNLNFIFAEHDKYRIKVNEKLIEKNIRSKFNNSFLIEIFSIYDQESNNPTSDYYNALIFVIENNRSCFYNIRINNDEQNIKEIVLKNEDLKALTNWLNTKNVAIKNEKPVYFKNDNKESILIISKFTEQNSFCQIIFNPMYYSVFYTEDMTENDKNAYVDLNLLAYFYYLTGRGRPF